MALALSDFRRPEGDNGRGLHAASRAGWSGGEQGLDYWVGELSSLGVKWCGVLDSNGDSLPLCQRLVAAGIFPVVRLLRRDPPPNDSPEPNPGHLSAEHEASVKSLVGAGVLYFVANDEPDASAAWKNAAIPADPDEAAKLVALNWLFDARMILDAGGYPGLPAISSGGNMNLIAALAELGRHEILLDGCWIAVRNHPLNRPLDYPDDPVNQRGVPLLPVEFDYGALSNWVFWDCGSGDVHSPDELNQERAGRKRPGTSVLQDHACFREFEYYYSLAQRYLGRPIPILSSDSPYLVGRRQDMRYPRITPQVQAELTAAMFRFMEQQAPDYYFACMAGLLAPGPGSEHNAWYGDFWKQAFENGTSIRDFPPLAVPGVGLGTELPVVGAVKALPVARRAFAPEPKAEARAAVLIPAPPPGKIYTLQTGDTLSSIARQFGTTITAIIRANQLAGAGGITAGTRLVIPSGKAAAPNPPHFSRYALPPPPVRELVYAVQPGDTLLGLASHFDTTISAIVSANGLTDSNRLRTGQELIIPIHKPAGRAGSAAPVSPHAAPRPVPPRPSGDLQLDPRLSALGVCVSPAMVVPGVLYWKLVGAAYLDPRQSSGRASVDYRLIDENGASVTGQVLHSSDSATVPAETDDNGIAEYPLDGSYSPERGEVGSHSAWVDGLPSDRVTGIGRPNGQAVSFRLTWQRTQK
ncbi:MAG: LysM peptidoglycan-binding domain-containing protein [Rudaea sp.]